MQASVAGWRELTSPANMPDRSRGPVMAGGEREDDRPTGLGATPGEAAAGNDPNRDDSERVAEAPLGRRLFFFNVAALTAAMLTAGSSTAEAQGCTDSDPAPEDGGDPVGRGRSCRPRVRRPSTSAPRARTTQPRTPAQPRVRTTQPRTPARPRVRTTQPRVPSEPTVRTTRPTTPPAERMGPPSPPSAPTTPRVGTPAPTAPDVRPPTSPGATPPTAPRPRTPTITE
jgi:hypothetical protein